MRLCAVILPLLISCLLSQTVNSQLRGRARVRGGSQKQQSVYVQENEARENEENADYDEDSTPEPALQYYSSSQGQDDQNRVVLVSTDDEYNGLYGHPTPAARSRADYNRPVAKTTSSPARTKEPAKETVQTIRNYSKVNDDGSFTFGYEAADGSFKEETRGTDCVVRGKYGYIDPDGNKREFTYVSGNPCDPNNPDQNNEEEAEREEETNEPENVPLNFPRKPLRPTIQRQHTTTHPPTTVFQNQYTSNSYSDDQDDDEREDENQLLQTQRPRASARPQNIPVPEEVTIRQRPRITINTTPVPLYQIHTQTTGKPTSITARPNYREPLQTQPPATTYRPSIQFFTQKAAPLAPSRPIQTLDVNKPTHFANVRKPIDFASEFQKFQQDNNIATTTTPRTINLKTYRPATTQQKLELPSVTPNPIYETQLVFDPATGQIDPSLFPQNVAYRIPFVPQQQQQQQQPQHQQQHPFNPSPQIISLEQLQQQNQQPVYQRQLPTLPTTRSPLQFPQFSQQDFNRNQENLQVLNSQQLYAQQQQLQHNQLHTDREAAKRQSLQNQANHRFQLGAQSPLRPLQQPGFFYQPASIDSFLN